MPTPAVPQETQRRLKVYILRVGNAETLKEIADHFGLSRQYVGKFVRDNKIPREPLTGRTPQKTVEKIVEYLRSEGKTAGLKRVGQRFGVNESVVRRIVEEFGIERIDLVRIPTHIKEAILRDYQPGETTLEDVANRHGVAKNTASEIIKELGGTVWTGRTYDIDFSVFGRNDPVVAYWMGFLFADGCLFQKRGSWGLRLTLSLKDFGHLENYCLDMGIPTECLRTQGTRAAEVLVTGESLPRTVKRWGIIVRKTYEFHEPRVGKRLLPHFLRGWMDGDGSISLNKCNGAIVCSLGAKLKKSLEYYRRALASLGFDGNILISPHRSQGRNHYYARVYRKRDVWQLRNLLQVSGNRHLERKWSRILERPRSWYLHDHHPSDDEIKEMVRLYREEELSCIEIGQQLQRSRATVAKHLKKAGLEVNREARLGISKKKKERIKGLAKEGHPYSAIAKIVGVQPRTASKYAGES